MKAERKKTKLDRLELEIKEIDESELIQYPALENTELVFKYRSNDHPICAPLLRGGPAELAKELGVVPETGYIDECHFCYLARKAIIDKFPDYLSPKQVYGLE